MKNINSVARILNEKGGVTAEDLKEFAVGPVSGRPEQLSIDIFDDVNTNKELLLWKAITAVTQGVWVINLIHNAYTEESMEALQDLIKDTLVDSKVYITPGWGGGVILLTRVF